MDEIVGTEDIKERHQQYNARFLAGCGLVLLLGLIILLGVITHAIHQDRQAAYYPGSVSISSHSRYRLPSNIRWDDTYLTHDSFTAVYNWYSTRFNLGAEARANGDCIELDGSHLTLNVERRTIVFLCNTPKGRTIFVTRSTTIR